jgi:hypothetical protein
MKGRYEMKIGKARRLVYMVLLLTVASAGLFVFRTIAESKMELEDIPPVPQPIVTDVIHYDLDLLNVTSNWPKDLSVENISAKEISGFEILIVAANDDGGPGEMVLWGTDPNNGNQTPLFKPKEIMTLPISPQAVKKFEHNGKPFLYVEVFRVWVNNDPKFSYSEGALLQQDEDDPRVYHVIRDAKGRSKSQHNHALPHITHSIRPAFPLGCCTREFYASITYDCGMVDSCDLLGRKCQITNNAYTVCSVCCPNQQATSYVNCHSVGTVCPPYLCDERQRVTYNTPCNCCSC